jgi:two-component system, chemotaxis family, protein-glutamate methylesterase/glutaminase
LRREVLLLRSPEISVTARTIRLAEAGRQEFVANRNLVVMGASAGGVEALQRVIAELPVTLKACVLIVLHTSPDSGTLLPRIFQRSSRLPVMEAQDAMPLRNGRIYVANPGLHLLVEDGLIRVIPGPRENRHRPAIDPLFRSAATSHGAQAIGVILTGMLDDGTSGLMLLRARGGAAIVQKPSTAMFPSMPEHALAQVPDAHVVPLEKIAACISQLTEVELPESVAKTRRAAGGAHHDRAEMVEGMEQEKDSATNSGFSCPECGGVLREVDDNGFLRFRCRVGHAYTARVLASEQWIGIDTALWSALRALEESAALHRRMAERDVNNPLAQAFEERAKNTEQNVKTLREFLVQLAQERAERSQSDEG